MTDYITNIIGYLERKRKEKEWSVYRLSIESGIDQATLRGAINHKKDICLSTLLKWAHSLDCSVIIEHD